MAESVFKVSVLGPNSFKDVFYIKYFVDMIYPCYRGFSEKIVARLDSNADGRKTKIFWIGE